MPLILLFHAVKGIAMTMQGLLARTATAAAALMLMAGSASAVTVYTTPSIGSPTAYTDFSTLCSFTCDGTVPYSQGGITVQYVGAPGQIWSTSQSTAPGGYSWYPNGGSTGYTDITLTAGGSFGAIELLTGSGWGSGANLLYELLNGSTVVASGNAGALPSYAGGFSTYGFSGGTFTELRVQGVLGGTTYSASNFEALALGSVAVGEVSAVPESSTWAMLLAGLVGVGAMRRSARRQGGNTLPALAA
jgi:hypothetical protein